MLEKIKKVVSSVLDIDQSQLTLETGIDNIIQWDSLAHMRIVLALEEEFEVTFSEIEIVEMLSISLIVEKLDELL